MAWPIHCPDRPAIPHDPTPDSHHHDQRRSKLRLAEAGHRKGVPAKPIPFYGRTTKDPQDNT